MGKNSLAVMMVALVALVALVVLFSPNIDLEGNIAGQAINMLEPVDDPNAYLDTTTEKESDLALVDTTADSYYLEEPKAEISNTGTTDTIAEPTDSELALVDTTADSYYLEEPKDEILAGDTIDTIYYPGEGVSDDPDGTGGTASADPDPSTTVSTEPVGYECRDSDGGSTPNTRGVTEIVASDGVVLMSHTDYCDDSRHVVEGTCDGTRISTGTIRCSRGARCSAGACSR